MSERHTCTGWAWTLPYTRVEVASVGLQLGSYNFEGNEAMASPRTIGLVTGRERTFGAIQLVIWQGAFGRLRVVEAIILLFPASLKRAWGAGWHFETRAGLSAVEPEHRLNPLNSSSVAPTKHQRVSHNMNEHILKMLQAVPARPGVHEHPFSAF